MTLNAAIKNEGFKLTRAMAVRLIRQPDIRLWTFGDASDPSELYSRDWEKYDGAERTILEALEVENP